jgi:cysteine desulfurase
VNKIYLDYAATTPIDRRVFDAMLPYFRENFGNSSSTHEYGQKADAALESARTRIAEALHCQPNEIIFTSGGSESDNLALRGVAFAERKRRGAAHILISPIEHPAVSRTAEQLAREFGFTLEYLPVDVHGIVSPDEVARRIREDTALVSVMLANNEIGTVNPISEIGSICRSNGIPFHTDAVQAAAYLPVDVQDLNVDLVSLGAHKFYGPKGIGALYIHKGTPILSMQTGGEQESGLRAGTHNIPYIVGFAEALHLAVVEREERRKLVQPMRDFMIGKALEEIPGSHLTGHPALRMPNHASFVFEGVDGNALLMMLDVAGFACSSGSACKTGNPEPSGVLLALGLPRMLALGSLRITLGKETSPAEVEEFTRRLPEIVSKARQLS